MPDYTFSLMQILRDDPDYTGALDKAKQDVKKTKEGLLQKSEQYCSKYKKEIEEGTKLHQKLLTEGNTNGLSEEQIFKGRSFIPTKHTPIMNFLYFLMRDEEVHHRNLTPKEVLEDYCKQFGYELTDVVKAYIEGVNLDLPQGHDDKEIDLEDVLTDEASKTPDEMDKYIYGNLTVGEFKKLKKLKALSRSNNKNEAFRAYTKCVELCKKYNLEFDKIPCPIK